MSPTTTAIEPPDTAQRAGDPSEVGNDRRAALKAGTLALAGLLAPSVAQAQGARKKGPTGGAPHPYTTGSTLDVAYIDPTSVWVSPELRLVRRITMGITETEGALAKSIGYDAYLERQLAASVDDTAVTTYVSFNYPYTDLSVDALNPLDSGQVQQQLTNAMIYRSAFSANQLKERMVEFWTDHFNILFEKVGYLKVVDDKAVIRANALGNFYTLLRASAHSVAMLNYLDQTASTLRAPNQNYAREIMELHTLGVNGGYTQTDVAELSRVLTGWTQAGRGNFLFNPTLHDFGAKVVLGVNVPASSSGIGIAAQQEGENMLTMLLTHPSTATFVSTKLLKFFLRYDPSPTQIAAVAAAYTSTQGDIKAMLRVVLSKANLTAAPAKYKRPYHLVISSVRALGVAVANAGSLASQISTAGHAPFAWETPDGYPDTAEYWAGNILPRWNYAVFISNAASTTTLNFNVATIMTTPTAAAIVANIDRLMFGGEMTQRLRDELSAYVAVSPTSTTRVRETVSLALSSSTFQYY